MAAQNKQDMLASLADTEFSTITAANDGTEFDREGQYDVAKRMLNDEIKGWLLSSGYYERLEMMNDAKSFLPDGVLKSYIHRYIEDYKYVDSTESFVAMTTNTVGRNGKTNTGNESQEMRLLPVRTKTLKNLITSRIETLDIMYPMAKSIVAQALAIGKAGSADPNANLLMV
jgi:hypothetical protein